MPSNNMIVLQTCEGMLCDAVTVCGSIVQLEATCTLQGTQRSDCCISRWLRFRNGGVEWHDALAPTLLSWRRACRTKQIAIELAQMQNSWNSNDCTQHQTQGLALHVIGHTGLGFRGCRCIDSPYRTYRLIIRSAQRCFWCPLLCNEFQKSTAFRRLISLGLWRSRSEVLSLYRNGNSMQLGVTCKPQHWKINSTSWSSPHYVHHPLIDSTSAFGFPSSS